ncbi:unnamed protein product [Protopolystoma xenopodis]|uniref:Peptidase S54 rhomboid domain-containing protein n=1 Tax=Protopolystoma xenopodis TaxID=117903 RepID=A0A3S5BWR9_9PLAT|nr:unnamed protein product [Protopolystoma xenopodis]
MASVIFKSIIRSSVPSLGASGGVCAVLGAFSGLYPDTGVCVPFIVHLVPHSFRAESVVNLLIGVEATALLLFARRSPIDHAAHLAGMLFGRSVP